MVEFVIHFFASLTDLDSFQRSQRRQITTFVINSMAASTQTRSTKGTFQRSDPAQYV
jgi:hypothetical protein